MKTKWINPHIRFLSIFSAIALAALPFTSKPTAAQTPLNASAEKKLNQYTAPTKLVSISEIGQYSPEAAPKLQLGSEGAPVRDVQAFLKEQGYYTGALDGVYGSATAAAVKAFQQKHDRLTNDGIVGYSTWNAMIEIKRNPSVNN
ncbi:MULTISPECIES: peptidoglycan-binding domain-containing protein [Nostocales]|uniref:Peptidoglycan-binding protein n=3 Tax=Nostocales TaxID=1161 RepID=A0A8S9SZC1_9CYAN|nr:peptidoglycan-binding domain-containing protein [Tolypothrix bouteillei]KAF3884764.1 peptidoglycan-binding protein [Tolypothrix bouteillei VB521301]